MISTKKKKVFSLLAGGLSFLLCLLVAEGVIRLHNKAEKRIRPIWIPDEYCGYLHTPNNQFNYEIENEGVRRVRQHRTNAYGFIGRELALKKADRVIRVAILGDSFTEALQVKEEDNFSLRLEGQLNSLFARSNLKFEIINAGVSGYSPISEYVYYKRVISKFKPDVVLLQLFANDVFEDNKAQAMSLMDADGLPFKLSRYFLAKNQQLKKEKKYLNNIEKAPSLISRLGAFLVDKSRFAEYIYIRCVKANKNSALSREMRQVPEFFANNYLFTVKPGNPLFKDKVFRDRKVTQTKKYIDALRQLVEADDARLGIFYVPIKDQMQSIKTANTFLNDALKQFSDEQDVPFLDLLSVFNQFTPKQVYLLDDGHLKEFGHKITAESLMAWLLDSDMLNAFKSER
ncbi:SGNH/GDSL hydrolase family protein [Candidatus Omnitrophota bacterium]